MVQRSCKYCGLKLVGGNPKKRFCCDAHKMKYHRILNKGFELVMVERSEKDLDNILRKMNYDGNESFFHIHKKEHGDSLSKDCWYVFIKKVGLPMETWKRNSALALEDFNKRLEKDKELKKKFEQGIRYEREHTD